MRLASTSSGRRPNQTLHLTAALLLQAAQSLGRETFAAEEFAQLPEDVRSLIDEARGELDRCREIGERIQDPRVEDTTRVLHELEGGALTAYPLQPTGVAQTVAGVAAGAAADETAADEQPGSEPMAKKHVFLSYCHDNQAEVAKLRDDLIAAGEAVWWDQDIVGGQDWRLAVRQAMKQSYAVVMCVSKETAARVKTGVYPEARDAIAAYREYPPDAVFLVPVRLSKCEVPPVPIDNLRNLDDLQYIDLFPPKKRNEGVERLVEALRAAPEHP